MILGAKSQVLQANFAPDLTSGAATKMLTMPAYGALVIETNR